MYLGIEKSNLSWDFESERALLHMMEEIFLHYPRELASSFERDSFLGVSSGFIVLMNDLAIKVQVYLLISFTYY